MRQHILVEPPATMAPIRTCNRRGAIAALLEGDVAVRGMIVGGIQLELGPCGWDEGAALHATFEGGGERDEMGRVGCQVHGCERVVEVRACGAVAVPVVVVEEVGALVPALVMQIDARAVVFFGIVRFGGGDVLDHLYLVRG